jgi:hypothetical protein
VRASERKTDKPLGGGLEGLLGMRGGGRSALKLFVETLDCESLEGGYRISCYSAKRLAYHMEPKMREVTPGEEWLLRRILDGMGREGLLHALCKDLGIISYPEVGSSSAGGC